MKTLYSAGLVTTPRDRVRARYPDAISEQGRFDAGAGRWIIRSGAQVLARGANASRAWEAAAKALPR